MDKSVLRISVVIILSLLWVGCSTSRPITIPTEESLSQETPITNAQPTATPQPTPTEEVLSGTITIWHSWNEARVPALVQILSGFQDQYPNVQFDVLYIPLENLRNRFETEAIEGGGPSILLGPAQWGPSLYDAGLIEDLSMLTDTQFLNHFNQAALDQLRYDNALLGLPYAIEGVVLYRNLSIIPEAADTFDDLVGIAKSATVGEKIGANLERSFYFAGAHLSGIGGELIYPDGTPAFNDDLGVEWIELLSSFEQVGATEFQSERDLELFKEDRVGFIIDGTWNLVSIAEALGQENVVIDPWPTYGDGQLSGYLQGEDIFLAVNPTDEVKQLAWEFMKFFTSADAQSILAESGSIPAVSGVNIANSQTSRLLAQAMTAMAGGTGYPVIPEIEFYPSVLNIALRSIFEGTLSPQEALQTAEASILTAIQSQNEPSSP